MNIRKYFSEDAGRIRCPSLQINDLASLLCGVKSVVYASVLDAEENRVLDRLCLDLKLEKVVLRNMRDIGGSDVTAVLIGNDHKKLMKAKKASSNVCSLDWGTGLDYPECCVKAYLDWRRPGVTGNLISHIYARTEKGRIIPFWMNNTLNFFSRINTPLLRREYKAFSALNAGQDREAIITWHPCSYFCAQTLKKGRTVYEFMREYMPRLTADRVEMLSKPVIFWDDFVFAVLNGSCRAGKGGIAVSYDGIGRPRALLGRAAAKALAAPGALRIAAGGAAEYRPPVKLPKGAAVLPFSGPAPAFGS